MVHRLLTQTIARWTGDEQVLDVGCGRGLLLIGAARRLSTGTAVGVDLWRAEDQDSNSPDVRGWHLDVVLSHWVVHRLPDACDCACVLDETLDFMAGKDWLTLARDRLRTVSSRRAIPLRSPSRASATHAGTPRGDDTSPARSVG